DHQHVSEIQRAARVALRAFRVVHRLYDLIRDPPVLEQRRGDAQVPVLLDGVVGVLGGKEGAVAAGASQYVESAYTLQQTCQQRSVRVDLGQLSSDHAAEARDQHAAFP